MDTHATVMESAPLMANSDRLERFSTELLRYFRASGHTQAGLANALTKWEKIKVTGSAVGEWLRGESEPSRDKVFALERLLEAEPGSLSKLLGYVPTTTRIGFENIGEVPLKNITVSASGVDLNELARLDPEAYEAIMRQAEIALDRARGRSRRR